MKYWTLFSVAALSVALPAWAQDAAPPATPSLPAALAEAQVADLLRTTSLFGAVQERPEWMDKSVTIAAEERPAAELVHRLLVQVGLKRYQIVLKPSGEAGDLMAYDSQSGKEDEKLVQPFGAPVTLKLENVKAEEALRKVASAAGVRMTFRLEDGLTRVELAKTPRAIKVYTIGSPEVDADPAVREALLAVSGLTATLARPGSVSVAAPAPPLTNLVAPMPPAGVPVDVTLAPSGLSWRDTGLPEKRVSLDVREREAREVLKDLLKQAQVDYVLEEDLPDRKVTLAFKNSPVAVALDVVCNTLAVGWRAERPGRKAKALVRIGAKYRRGEGQATLEAPLIFAAPTSTEPATAEGAGSSAGGGASAGGVKP